MVAEEDCVTTIRKKRLGESTQDADSQKKIKIEDEKQDKETTNEDALTEDNATVVDCLFTDLGPLMDLGEFTERTYKCD